jgi:flagellar biosynthesis protein FlhG
MSRKEPVQVIAVTSGKGGVGKTNVAVNLSLALAKRGRRVMLLDADLGLAKVDSLLGLAAARTLQDVIDGRCELREVILQGPGGISVVPAPSGCMKMTDLTLSQQMGLIRAFSDVSDGLDVLIIDTAPGINSSVINFMCASRELLLVVCDEPTSLTSTYALIKILSSSYGVRRFHILVNMTRDSLEGPNVFARMVKATNYFLDVSLGYAGSVPYDERMRMAIKKQLAVYEAFPRSRCSLAFKDIAERIDSWPLPAYPRGNLEFFSERLIASSKYRHAVDVMI